MYTIYNSLNSTCCFCPSWLFLLLLSCMSFFKAIAILSWLTTSPWHSSFLPRSTKKSKLLPAEVKKIFRFYCYISFYFLNKEHCVAHGKCRKFCNFFEKLFFSVVSVSLMHPLQYCSGGKNPGDPDTRGAWIGFYVIWIHMCKLIIHPSSTRNN